MIKDGVLIDTSVLIEFFKGQKSIGDDVLNLLQANRGAVTGIVIAELLQGMKNLKEEFSITDLMEGMQIFEVTTSTWIMAGRIALGLRRKGLNLPLTDIAIASLAIEHSLQIFTLDKHFGQIPGVNIYRHLPL
ncbi:MAG: PIN domain-containing protein [Nitrospirota bacterium]